MYVIAAIIALVASTKYEYYDSFGATCVSNYRFYFNLSIKRFFPTESLNLNVVALRNVFI